MFRKASGRTLAPAFGVLLLAALPGWVLGQSKPAAGPPRFERDVQPILAANCFQCHGEEGRKGGLDLRTLKLMLQGGDSGPAITKGSAEKSLLIKQVAERAMPPGKRKKLTDAQVAVLREWINAGAPADQPDRIVGESSVSEKDRQFWAFLPPARPPLPHVRQADRVRTAIDAFVLAKLESKGLTFSPDADKVTLLRRVYFDVLGLPPSIEEANVFLADTRPDAYEQLIDRLLASPHYGERWGRHWLDAAGYADTGGTDNDAEIISVREGLWKYRDYVVGSLNADKPYDQFLTEQIAGDELEDWRSGPTLTAQMRDRLIATGFLRTAVDNTDAYELNRPLERYAVIHDTIEIITSNVLGLTVACARCHDHKFDPIPQRDYYRLMACLTPAYNPATWIQPKDRTLPEVSLKEKEQINGHNAEIDRQLADINRQVAAIVQPAERRIFDQKLATLPAAIRADTKTAIETPAEKRSAVQKYLAEKLGPTVKAAPHEIDKVLSPAERQQTAVLHGKIPGLNAQRRSFQTIQALFDVGPPPVSHLLRRGNHETPGTEVQPGFVAVLSDPRSTASAIAPTPPKSSGRRLALARWLTRPDHPLTARVFVNRVWQHHFGEGIVSTPDNFGHSGARPTHPELLDWLATEFVGGGWKMKTLHKLILTSTVYRQASSQRELLARAAESVDPANQLLGRMRLRRIESEIVRDAVLAVSGKLDATLGGPPIPLEPRKDGMVVIAEKNLPSPTAKWRRSLYLLARRNYPLSLLGVFDQPIVSTNCTRRIASAVPLQSLTMMNDDFLLEHAENFAGRVVRAAGEGAEMRIETAFRLALARKPTAKEMAWSVELLDQQARRHLKQKVRPEQANSKALASLCHMLLCANEFLYVE